MKNSKSLPLRLRPIHLILRESQNYKGMYISHCNFASTAQVRFTRDSKTATCKRCRTIASGREA